jgi:hypothetical protein
MITNTIKRPIMHNKIKSLALLMLLAANTATACETLYSVTREDVDQDGNTTYTVTLTDYARNNPTDTNIVRLGSCFADLMDGATGMASVVMDGRRLTYQDAQDMGEF